MKKTVVDTKKIWLSQKEAMKYLGVSKDWLKQRRDEGKLNYSVVGTTAFYIKSQIDKLIIGGAVTGVNHFRKEV